MSMDLSALSDRSWRVLFSCCVKCNEFQHPQPTETTVPTCTISIYVGLKERESEIVHSVDEVRDAVKRYCNDIGFCVSLTQTEFIYTNGSESGVIIGLINYPRFPSNEDVLWRHALNIAAFLQCTCGQLRVSIVGPTDTTMLTAPRGIQ